MCFVYILQSLKDSRYYIGSSQDVVARLKRHNAGGVRATKFRRPFKVVYTAEYDTWEAALAAERKIKSYKGGAAFKKLISGSSSDG